VVGSTRFGGLAEGQRTFRRIPRGLPAHSPEAASTVAARPCLERTIQTEIVPRLLLQHPPAAVEAVPVPHPYGPLPTSEQVDLAAELALRHDAGSIASYVNELRYGGMELDRLYLDLFAPVARRLGAWWEADRCNFAEVTLGMWRLHSLVAEFSPEWPTAPRSGPPPRALLASMPGSQHTFGLLLVAEYFRRAGWEVWSDPSADLSLLRQTARQRSFDLIGLSASTNAHGRALSSVILALREASRHPDPAFMAGGPAFDLQPGLAGSVGIDFVAVDARDAVERAESLIESRSARHVRR
jgi:methanogenic corrinoid protein MtbC1